MAKEKPKQSFRQRWLPTFDDAEEYTGNWSCISDPVLLHIAKRWGRTLVLGGLLIWGGYQGIGNDMEYSEGQRVGVVNKISEKGLIWKTKEGQLSLEGRTSTGAHTGAGVWDFSIDESAKHGENVDGLYSQIRQEMENGQRVKITYKEPLITWPWRAETDYLVQSVEPLETKVKR